MFKRNALAIAVGSVALFSGCATSPTTAGLTIEPVMSVRGGVGAEAQYRIGRYYQGQMRHDAAEQAFLKAIALDPAYVEAHNALGTVYFELGRIQKAEEQFKLAIAIAPERAHLHNNLGYLYQEIGRTNDAVSAYSEAFRLDPKNIRILNNLATLTCQDKGECMAAGSGVIAASSVEQEPSPAPQMVASGTSFAPSLSVAPAPANATVPVAQRSTIEVARAEPSATSVPAVPTVQLASVGPNVWELRPIAKAPPNTNAPAEPVATLPQLQHKVTPTQSVQVASGRLEVANGNGVRGMAKRIGGYLREQGYAAPRLTNHQTFNQKKTEIQYVAGSEHLARQIEQAFGQPAHLVKVTSLDRHAPVRVILGKDFNESNAVAQGSRAVDRVVALGQQSQQGK